MARRARPLLGTLVEIQASGDAAVLHDAINCAFSAVEQVHGLMSFHDPASDVSRVNRAPPGAVVEVMPMTWKVLTFARRVWEASAGAFDITISPCLVQLGYLPQNETCGQGDARGAAIGFRYLEFLPDKRVRRTAEIGIDLGGIAKGYAVDCAVAVLIRRGIEDFVVNAGGDLRVGRTTMPIHLRNPACPGKLLPLVELSNAAIATSGTYFSGKTFADRPVHPIIDPCTGQPAPIQASVSVIAPDCMTADALTKCVALQGKDAARLLLAFDARAIEISELGEVRAFPSADSAQEPSRLAT